MADKNNNLLASRMQGSSIYENVSQISAQSLCADSYVDENSGAHGMSRKASMTSYRSNFSSARTTLFSDVDSKDPNSKLDAWRGYSTTVRTYVTRRETSNRMSETESTSTQSTERLGKGYNEETIVPEIESLLSLVKEYTSNSHVARIKAWCLYFCTVPRTDIALDQYGSLMAIEETNRDLRRAWADHKMIIIHPLSTLRVYMDFVTVFLLAIQLIILPLQLSLIVTRDDQYWRRSLLYLNLITDFWFVFDIQTQFRTAIMKSRDNDLITSPAGIRHNYFTTWFLLDLVSSIPIDIFIEIYSSMTTSCTSGCEKHSSIDVTSLKAIKISRLVKVLKLLRLGKLIRSASIWDKLSFQFHDVMFITQFLRLIVLTVLVAHFLACVQYGVPAWIIEWPVGPKLYTASNGYTNDTAPVKTMADSWIILRRLYKIDGVSVSTKYSWSALKALSHMICIGYGQFPPLNYYDIIVTIFTIFIGAVWFAVFLGYVITAMHARQVTRHLYNMQSSQLQDYMCFRKLPLSLRNSITEYYEARYEGCVFDEDSIIAKLNPKLAIVVRNTSRTWHLETGNSPIRLLSPNLLQEVSSAMILEAYLTNDVILVPKRTIRRVYFIDRGFISEYRDHVKIRSYGKGCMIFGNILYQTSFIRSMRPTSPPSENKTRLSKVTTSLKAALRNTSTRYSGNPEASYMFRVANDSYFVCETTVFTYELDIGQFNRIMESHPLDHQSFLTMAADAVQC